ncbi:MAG: hypothetical protein Ct9H300mP3_11390 [Gammaproteobacteria bacterium]|nr:MAG: hypothetical protein Ct9H300mP3_11390 [Gammaproteobacteria bacterium]
MVFVQRWGPDGGVLKHEAFDMVWENAAIVDQAKVVMVAPLFILIHQ